MATFTPIYSGDRLLDRVQAALAALLNPLLERMGALPEFDVAPAAAPSWAGRMVVIRTKPRTVAVCVQDSSGAWAWCTIGTTAV